MIFDQLNIEPWPTSEAIFAACLAQDRKVRCADLDLVCQQLHHPEQTCLPR
jgi:hypothetical protein